MTAAGSHLISVTFWFLAVAVLVVHRFYLYCLSLL